MLMPSIFRENLLDDFFDFPGHRRSYQPGAEGLMKTDIRDNGHDYELTMNLPGIKKENVRAELKNGYLIVAAAANAGSEDKDGTGKYIRRERYVGSCSRSFYVGEEVGQEDIKARFQDGTLKLTIPKREEEAAADKKAYITIEG